MVTDIVSVTGPPFWSLVPKLYVGFATVASVKLPSPLLVQAITPVLYGRSEYPATVYDPALAHTSAEVGAPCIA